MFRKAVLTLVFLALACHGPRNTDVHIAAANAVTDLYSRSRLAQWNIHAAATGRDCRVLLIETSMIMEDSMIEAMQYGAGAYDVFDGGVQKFMSQRDFNGVAYRDSTGKIWTYGEITELEAETLAPCR